MPTYEYECRGCGHRFERRQRFDEEPVKVCPECSGETRRVLHPVGIVFKGSGWYITDSRGSNGATVSGEDKSGDSKAEKSEAKSESKNGAAKTTAEAGKK